MPVLSLRFFPLTFLPLPNLMTNVYSLVATYNNRNSEKHCVLFKCRIILHILLQTFLSLNYIVGLTQLA